VNALEIEFDAESMTSVSITQYAVESDQSIEAVWEHLWSWETARLRMSLLERALTIMSGDVTGLESTV